MQVAKKGRNKTEKDLVNAKLVHTVQSRAKTDPALFTFCAHVIDVPPILSQSTLITV